MTTIGIIGAGHIGSQLARLAVQHGHDVVIANSRGPETLTDLVDELRALGGSDAGTTGGSAAGPADGLAAGSARAATRDEAAAAGEIVVVTTPLAAIETIPVEPLVGKVVIDTNNYYPGRDGDIPALDDETTTTAELLQDHLPGARVVKAFNHIGAADLTGHATPAGTPDRRALVVAGDDAEAKRTVTALIDAFGFDVVDAGPLAEGWRIQRDTPGYGPRFTAEELRAKLAEATRG